MGVDRADADPIASDAGQLIAAADGIQPPHLVTFGLSVKQRQWFEDL